MSVPSTEPINTTRPQWIAVWALLPAAFISLLDVTVVSLAVPTLLPPLSMIGFGMGLSKVALMSKTLALAPKDSAGAAVGLIQTG